MNKFLIVLVLLLFGVLAGALVKRSLSSSGEADYRNDLSEDLNAFQGEWYAAPANGDRSFIAEFKGRSLRLVANIQWRRTHTLVGLDQRGREQLIVIDNGADALVYRFEGDDVLWLEFQPDGRTAAKAIRFERVMPSD